MRAWVSFVLLGSILVPAFGVSAMDTCPCSTSKVLAGLAGDTYVFKLNPPAPGMNIFAAQTSLRITGFYDEPKDEVVSMFAWYSPQGGNPGSLIAMRYRTVADEPEFNLEVLSDQPNGVNVHVEDDRADYGGFTIEWGLGDDVHFDDLDWYFVLSVPEAVRINVNLFINHNKFQGLPILADAVTGGGLVAATEDFDGTAQVSVPNYTASHDMSIGATAPPGQRGVAIMSTVNSQGIVWYEVDGPGGNDDSVIGTDGAAGLHGRDGAYAFHVVEQAVAGSDAVSGHVAAFAAPRIPLVNGALL